MLVICGLIFLFGGMIMKIWSSKERNGWYGYRTPLSTSSDEAWKLAQKHCAKMMLKYGFIMIVIGLSIYFYLQIGRYTEGLLVIEQLTLLLFLFLIIFFIHHYLKRIL